MKRKIVDNKVDCCTSSWSRSFSSSSSLPLDLKNFHLLKQDLRKNEEENLILRKNLNNFESEILSAVRVVKNIEVGSFTVVEVELQTVKATYRGEGISRKSEQDLNNPDLAFKIALGRAKKSLMNRINKETSRQKDSFVG